MRMTSQKVIYLEPYYGGSHGLLIDMLQSHFPGNVYTMRPKKWHWRMRSAALTWSQQLPPGSQYQILFASSMLNLVDLLALRPDYAAIPRKILYCHENQFEYPKQYEDKEERDYYFLHATVCSCLVADVVAWNSHFNMESFLKALGKLTTMLPIESDCKPNIDDIAKRIRAKSVIVPMPVDVPKSIVELKEPRSQRPLRIAWPHRWEHDKDPHAFLCILNRLVKEAQASFTVIVFGGESFEGNDARKLLVDAVEGDQSRIEGCGRIDSREEYLKLLKTCDVAVSTAIHEFFGVAMAESARLGCRVVCPKRLSYPELFKEECLYTTEARLYKMLREYCQNYDWVQRSKPFDDFLPGVWQKLDFAADGRLHFEELMFANKPRDLPDKKIGRKGDLAGFRTRALLVFVFTCACMLRTFAGR